MDSSNDYGKVIAVRLKKSTIKKLEELKSFYSELYDLQLTNSELLKIIINKEIKKQTKSNKD